MSTDLHVIQEIKLDGQWHFLAYRRTDWDIERGKVMCVLAQDEGFENIVPPPQGLPEDFRDLMSRRVFSRLGLGQKEDPIPGKTKYADAHTVTWLGPIEIRQLYDWYVSYYSFNPDRLGRNPKSIDPDMKFYVDFGFCEGNSWHNFDEFRDDYEDVEDIRWIVWFDN